MTSDLMAVQAVAEAQRLHTAGYNCAESVLGAVAAAAGGEAPPLRLATGFGGGLGRTGDVCGAVTGGCMALGWLRGRDDPQDKASYAKTAVMVRELLAGFRAGHGTLLCSELTGYDLSDPSILPRFAQDDERRVKCERFIATAARLTAELLAAEGAQAGA